MSESQQVSRAPHPRRLSFDTAAIWVLTATTALAAIVFTTSATLPFLFTKVSILAIGGLIAIALYILARLTRGNVIVPPVALLGAVWLVPLAYLLSALFSGAGVSASIFGTELETDTFGFMLILAVFASLAALVFRRTAHYRTFYKVGGVTLGVVLLAQVIILIISKFSPTFITPTSNLVGSFTDLGILVGLGVVTMLLALRFVNVSKRLRIGMYIGSALGLFVLALVNSSLIWTLVALVALGLFIEAIMHRRVSSDEGDLDGVEMLGDEREHDAKGSADSMQMLPAPLITLIISLFFLIGGSTIGNAFSTSLGANFLDVRPSWQSTFTVGSHTYASSPLFGSGPNTFATQWLKFRDRSLNDTVFWNVNFVSGIGFIPTSFITVGVLGALAWIAYLGLLLFVGLRSLLFRAPEDAFVRFVSVSSFVGALYVAAVSVFAVPGPVVLAVGALMTGIFISSLRYAGNRREWGIVFSKNPRVGFVIVFGLTILLLASIVAAYTVTERYLGDVAYAEGVNALNAGDLVKATADANRSILFARSDRAYQLGAAIGIAQMNQIASNTKLTPSDAQTQFQAALSSAVSSAVTATQIGPNNFQNWAVLGQVYQTVVPLNIQGAYDNAKAAYTHAASLNPSNPTIPYVLAQLEISAKNYTAAETDLTNSINLKHDYTQAIFLLSQLEVQEGKAKEALQAAQAAAYFAPNDPTVLFQVGILESGTGNPDAAIAALSQAVQISPTYANARFFLAVAYATKADYASALKQLQALAALSADNAKAVAADIALLQAGKNPFPASQFGALGIPGTPIAQPTVTTGTPAAPGTTQTEGR